MSRPAIGVPDVRRGSVRDEDGLPFSQRAGESLEDFARRCAAAVMVHVNNPHRERPKLVGELPTLESLASLADGDQRLVYFAECRTQRGPIKIGIASDVTRRLAELQVACPYPLRLMGTVAGGKVAEVCLHRLFSAFKIHGEWFWPEPEVTNVIKSLLREQKNGGGA